MALRKRSATQCATRRSTPIGMARERLYPLSSTCSGGEAAAALAPCPPLRICCTNLNLTLATLTGPAKYREPRRIYHPADPSDRRALNGVTAPPRGGEEQVLSYQPAPYQRRCGCADRGRQQDGGI